MKVCSHLEERKVILTVTMAQMCDRGCGDPAEEKNDKAEKVSRAESEQGKTGNAGCNLLNMDRVPCTYYLIGFNNAMFTVNFLFC